MAIEFGMMVLYASDLQRSIGFYRQLGLDVPDPRPDRPVAIHRMDNGVTIIFTTGEVAVRFDRDWTPPPTTGYRQVMEFLVDDDAAVDELWNRLTATGYHGRTAPGRFNGPYAAMIDDPDGNVVLISNDKETNARPSVKS